MTGRFRPVMRAPLLRRAAHASTAPRHIVHIGLGAFSRAHQAYYTQRVNIALPADQWAIIGFTGRHPAVANALSRQGGLYHLITRDATRDTTELITSIAAAHDGGDLRRLAAVVGNDSTSVVTLTVTEGGYHLGEHGRLDLHADDISADVAALKTLVSQSDVRFSAALAGVSLTSMPARMVLGLEQRRRNGAGPLAVVPCDNLSGNGVTTQSVVTELAGSVSPELRDWILANLSFVTTSVDRITPAVTLTDLNALEKLTGVRDNAAVVTEPFHDWVLSGTFPAGRPLWEHAGARFVDDIKPFEQRKLWLLNGAHSLLAYAGQLAGYRTVAEAVRNAQLLAWVVELWDEAARALPASNLDLDRYRTQLLERFQNPRIDHRLSQIAAEGSSKVRLRAVGVLVDERRRGREGTAAARVIAAWIAWLLTSGDDPLDSAGGKLERARARASLTNPNPLLEVVDPRLAADGCIADQVRTALDEVLRVRRDGRKA